MDRSIDLEGQESLVEEVCHSCVATQRGRRRTAPDDSGPGGDMREEAPTQEGGAPIRHHRGPGGRSRRRRPRDHWQSTPPDAKSQRSAHRPPERGRCTGGRRRRHSSSRLGFRLRLVNETLPPDLLEAIHLGQPVLAHVQRCACARIAPL